MTTALHPQTFLATKYAHEIIGDRSAIRCGYAIRQSSATRTRSETFAKPIGASAASTGRSSSPAFERSSSHHLVPKKLRFMTAESRYFVQTAAGLRLLFLQRNRNGCVR